MKPPQSSLFGCRFDAATSSDESARFHRLNLACLAVGSTSARRQFRRHPAPPQSSLFGCRFDGNGAFSDCDSLAPPQSSLFGCRFDTSITRVIVVTPPAPPQSSLFGCRFDSVDESERGRMSPPQSSLFGCRFDADDLKQSEIETLRLNLACLAVGSTSVRIKHRRFSSSASI